MTRRFSVDGTADTVSTDDIVEWCDLARRAPSAGFSQGVHFLIRSDVSATLGELGSLEWWTVRQPDVLAATSVVVVLVDPSAYVERYGHSDKSGRGLDHPSGWRVPYWFTDAGMAVQNLLLLVEAAQHGALFAGVFRDPADALSAWGVPAGIECVGLVFIGVRHPDDRPSGSSVTRSRRSSSEVVHLEAWGPMA